MKNAYTAETSIVTID